MSNVPPPTMSVADEEDDKALRERLLAIIGEQRGGWDTVSSDDSQSDYERARAELETMLWEHRVFSIELDTVRAVIRASSHYAYNVPDSLKLSNADEDTVRDTATLFETLYNFGASPRSCPDLVRSLRSVTGHHHLNRLLLASPDYAYAIVSIVAFFSQGGDPPRSIDRDIRDAILEEPSVAQELIQFAQQRGILRLEDIDSLFLDARRDIVAPLRDGAL